MQKTLKEIAAIINGEVIGDESVVITGVAGIKEAGRGDITFLANPKYIPFIEKTQAAAIIVSRDIKSALKPIICLENPSLGFEKVVLLFSQFEVKHPKGIHPTAVLGKDVCLGKNVSIGPYVIIDDNVSLGDNTIIYGGSYIGHSTQVGSDTLIYANVTIRESVHIGNRVVVHSGTVIGSDGFGFAAINGKHHRIPQIGTVVIEDDVDIGSNVTIDRARFDKTIIGKGTKIDNLVQIAHNVVIGEDSIIVAQVGISGSTNIGKGVTLAGQSGVAGHLTVGDGAIVAGRAGVIKSIPANTVVSGFPAKPHETAKKVNACVQNLPKLYEKVNALKKKIEELEARLNCKT